LLVERKEKIYSCCPDPYPEVVYYIVLKRRPSFYIFNMIIPCIALTLVGLLGLVVAPDSGEKIGIGITFLLSMTGIISLIHEV
jgi:nicotinic acetylcholine receptor, invertebrate